MEDMMAGESVTARAAGDGVVLTMDGKMQISGLAISDDLMSVDKKDKLQNAIKEAHSDAMKKMQRVMASKMQEMGGLDNFKMPGAK